MSTVTRSQSGLIPATEVREAALNLAVHQMTGFTFRAVNKALDRGRQLVRDSLQSGTSMRVTTINRNNTGFVRLVCALVENGAEDARAAVTLYLFGEGKRFEVDTEKTTISVLVLNVVPA